MKRLYYVRRPTYDMIISDDGVERRMISTLTNSDVFVDGEDEEEIEDAARDMLAYYEDDSDWAVYDETVDELADFAEIVAERIVDDD